jgi:hypothetical protein
MKSLLGDFSVKVGKENMHTLKSIIVNENMRQISNDKGISILNSATSKHLIIKRAMFPRRNIHKFSFISPDGKSQNKNHILKDRRRDSSELDVSSHRRTDCDTDPYVVVANYT